jgi:hypothetical protein
MTFQKKRTLVTTFITLAILMLTALSPGVFALDTGAWAYARDVTVTESGSNKLIVDTQLLARAAADGRDLRILSGATELPYKAYLSATPTEQLPIARLTASSMRPAYRSITYGPEKLTDGDIGGADGSFYQADGTIDPTTTWVIADLGKPVLASSAQLTPGVPGYTAVKVEGSNDYATWTTLRDKIETTSPSVRFTPATFRYIRFTFWHDGDLVLRELQVFGDQPGYLLFNAPKGSYRLLYGNPLATAPRYDTSGISVSIDTPSVVPGQERYNPDFRADADGDNKPGMNDNCPLISNADQRDSDADGLGDVCDNCAAAKNKDQSDWDGDGIGDACDNCQSVANADQYDDDLNGIGYACDDNDRDGVQNRIDNCVAGHNPGQEDTDRSGVGDVCEDADNDSVAQYKDNCPSFANADQRDQDADGKGDTCDNCASAANADQYDADKDGVGDACEDRDGDGVADVRDSCPALANADQVDFDRDGRGDACDNCPNHSNWDQADKDRDGTGDLCDTKDGRALENKWVVWSILIVAIAVIGGFAFMMYKKPAA